MLERRTVLICTIKVTFKATGTTFPATTSTDTSVNIKYHDVSIIIINNRQAIAILKYVFRNFIKIKLLVCVFAKNLKQSIQRNKNC